MFKDILIYTLLGMLIIFCSTELLQGQSNLISGKNILELRQNKGKIHSISSNPLSNSSLYFQSLNWSTRNIYPTTSATAPVMPKVYNFDDLGFFCKVEVLMEKKTKMPIKIRLGEVQYVERMEGKYEFPLIVN